MRAFSRPSGAYETGKNSEAKRGLRGRNWVDPLRRGDFTRPGSDEDCSVETAGRKRVRFGRPTQGFLDRCVLPGAKRREHDLEGSARKARGSVFHARSMAIARRVMAIASSIVRQRSGTRLCRTSCRANWCRGHAKGQTCGAQPHCDGKFAASHGASLRLLRYAVSRAASKGFARYAPKDGLVFE